MRVFVVLRRILITQSLLGVSCPWVILGFSMVYSVGDVGFEKDALRLLGSRLTTSPVGAF
jgi:hypothetical protein